jgi:DNA-binding MarR family transcriptional regulator
VLGERDQIARQTMAELVAHLERHGCLEQVPDPTDRRARLVRATGRGREVFALAREITGAIEARWIAHLGAARMRDLRESLEMLRTAP